MPLSRAWVGKLSAASLAALLVPGAMMAALGVLVIAGGFGSIGSLGQAFTGPSLPATGGLPPGPRWSPAAVAELTARSAARASAPLPARATGPGSGSALASSGAPASAPAASSLGTPASVSRPPRAQAAATGGTATAPPSSEPSHPSTIVDQVVNAGKSVAKQLPEPVGSPAAQALQSAGATADQVIPPAFSGATPR